MNEKNEKSQDNNANKARHGNPALNMLVHVFVGTFCFLLVATAAFGIDLYVQWMQHNGASEFLVLLLEGFARALAIMDVFCALWYIVTKFFDDAGE